MQFADGLDSNCYAPPREVDGPTDDICGEGAVAWVELPSGTRRYLCAYHAGIVERFGDVEQGVRVRVCERCHRETPRENIDVRGGDWLCEDCAD